MITIIDYGLGNIQAFSNIYRRLGIDALPASTPQDLQRADKIILPCVGAFDWGMSRLQSSGLREVLDEQVLGGNKPVLGVCVGMQMMANFSDEGSTPGLGWIDASVVKFDVNSLQKDVKLPHMGWNDVVPVSCDDLFLDIDNPLYYFLHSYHFKPVDQSVVLAKASYGFTFTAAVSSGNVYGTQFHPEKSHHWGVSLLKNFAEIA